MAISRSLMNRQLRADGGIMQVAPREKFGLGSKLKKFVRKIIPNEVADIAVKAAPFVAPFNPAVAAAMAGLGSFDQTGSIGNSLKRGALTYGGGQAARYIGGAGFQGNPFTSGAFTPSGFTSGFSSPLGSDTGLGKFFSNRGTEGVQGIDMATGGADGVGVIQDAPTKALASELSYVPETSIDMVTGGADGVGIIQDSIINKTTVAKEPGFLKNLFDGVSNQDYGKIGNTIKDGAKKFGKAMFTNKDGSIDKAAVMGAITFAASYAEALALANDAGIELTEEDYNQAQADEKKAEYAGYLTNFFGGVKDGGRIGFESGANEMIKTQLLEEIIPDTSTEEMIMIMTEDGPKMVKKSDYESMSGMFRDTTTGFGANINRIEEANGGRIGLKFGTKPEEAEVGIMTVDVEAGGDEEEENDLMAGITFSSAEKSYLFRKLGGAGGSDRSFTMPQLYRVLSNPDRYAADAAVLKEIAIMGLGEGQKDGGRIGLKGGGTDKMEQYKKYVSDMIKDGETAVDFEEFLKMTNYKDGGRIGLESGANDNFYAPPPKEITEFNKDMVTEFMAGNMPEFKGELVSENYTQGGVSDLDAIFKIHSMGGSYDDIREALNSSLTNIELEKIIQSMKPKQENFYAETRAKGGRIGFKGGSGSSDRVAQLMLTRSSLLANDPDEDVSFIDIELERDFGIKMKAEGGIMKAKMPTGQIRKNNAGVVERDYRDEGGFVPVGIKERADDVPAMLSKNEFVMTADAVRGIGNGSVEEGSKKLYNTMKQAEKVGKA